MTAAMGGNAAKELRALVERIERLHVEREELSKDIMEIFAEGNAKGFERNAVKAIIQERRQASKDPEKFKNLQDLMDLYRSALSGGPEVGTRPALTRASRTRQTPKIADSYSAEIPAPKNSSSRGSPAREASSPTPEPVATPPASSLEPSAAPSAHDDGLTANSGPTPAAGEDAAPPSPPAREPIASKFGGDLLDIPDFLRGRPQQLASGAAVIALRTPEKTNDIDAF